ncbi:MAG: insulinase family protein [Firmicutes bacterium]|nr:insulinase family protein [Bacillota bacterium]
MQYQRTVLDNGIRIISEELNHVRSASIGFWFRTGSRNERPEQAGLSHLIEHLTFKGTAKRSAKDIAVAFDTLGGQVNAVTSKEYTCYYAKILDEHFATAVEVLADMILNSTYQEDLLEREKGVVLEEIKMYEDSPDELVHDLFNEAVFAHHPLGRPILGTEETLRSFSQDDIWEYRKARYTPDNLVVAVAGHVDHATVVKEVERYFGGWQGEKKGEPKDIPPYRPSNLKRTKDIEQAHIILGVPGLSRVDSRKYALFLLDNILGGGMSSRLFQELREERGMVYTTYSYHAAYYDSGVFGVYAGTSPDRVDEVRAIVEEQFADIANNGVTEEELSRSKEQLKGSLMLGLENTSSRMGRLGKGELFGETIKTPSELVEIVNKITGEEVAKVAREVLAQELSSALVLPGKGSA